MTLAREPSTFMQDAIRDYLSRWATPPTFESLQG